MTTFLHMKRGVAAILLTLTFVLQGTTSVLAGTTGTINGTVADASSGKPISGASITAASPSQTVTTTSDASGRFTFLSLNPDTYTVTAATTSTYDSAAVSGVTVQADQTLTVSVAQPAKLKVIGSVTSRSPSALVKPGTTADVYSINAVTQDKASALGGGGTLNSAWSAISSVPGVFVAPNQAGYIGAGATISIRGGDYDQIGYELDGIPVNRSFDNYPSGPLSSLGQQELQVYTGATPANAEAEGISGYINQVIRTGTAPASRNLTLATGAPTFYGKLAFEAGGANPSRTFSYYLGAGAYNQSYRYYDQYNGASLQSVWGSPLIACPANIGGAGNVPASEVPSCVDPATGTPYTNRAATPAYVLGAYQNDLVAGVQDRDTIVNLHFGIPRKNGNKDDVQFLFDNNFINNLFYNSTNDQGGAQFLTDIGVGAPTYTDGYTFTGAPAGTLLPAGFSGGGTSAYFFPDSPGGRPFGAQIAPNRRDTFVNDQAILKLQYQHNFGTSAYLRVYGYSYYSDWLQNGPQSAPQNFLGAVPSQYLLFSHTRGVSATFSDQLNSQNLLTVQGSYTTANSTRYNNRSGALGASQTIGYLVDSSNPFSGLCYAANPGGPGVVSGPCAYGTFHPQVFTINNARNNTVVPAATFGTCGGGPCEYVVGGNAVRATFNQVVPKFSSFSITDQFTPSSRLNVNVGLRYDQFQFVLPSTFNSDARTLFYNAYNLVHPTAPVINADVNGRTTTFSVWQPRLGMTYSFNPATVLRASYGRYAEAPNSAFEQYNFLQPNSVGSLLGFQAAGLPSTPSHLIRPQISTNYDLSFEHQFKGDTSVKLTPFLRKTQDQIQQFYLDPRTNFVSGLNVGKQTSQGVELEVDKGDFSRNGLAGRLSFTYTNSYINYTALPNGSSVIDSFNTTIGAYNAFTKTGGGAPCYTTTGAADPACAAGSIANPYYNAPAQPLMDVHGNYATYNIFPAGNLGSAPYFSYGAPYVTTLILQYKRGPLAITPALQFSGGSRYGAPATTPGIDPTSCTAGLAGSTAGDARYPYGAPGGAPFDAAHCAATIVKPNNFTNRFDNVGAFVSPNNLLLHTQITYDVNKRLTLVGNFANIVNRCFGGTKVPFAVNHACNYSFVPGGNAGTNPVGNVFNPGDNIQPMFRSPYAPIFPSYPFNMFFEARLKL